MKSNLHFLSGPRKTLEQLKLIFWRLTSRHTQKKILVTILSTRSLLTWVTNIPQEMTIFCKIHFSEKQDGIYLFKLWNLFKVNNKDTRTTSMTLLLLLMPTLNRFHTLFWCIHCWLWTSKYRLKYKYFQVVARTSPNIYNEELCTNS